MTEAEPLKPDAKRHSHQINVARPVTDGHNLAEKPDPELDRNIPSFTKEKITLNLDAKPFEYKPKYYPQNPTNQQEYTQNTYNQNQYYNQNNNFMGPPPGFNVYGYPIANPQYIPNYNHPNYNNVPRNNQNMPNMYPSQPNYPPQQNYSRQNNMNPGNPPYQNNNNHNNYRQNNFKNRHNNYNNNNNNNNNNNSQYNQRPIDSKNSQSSLDINAKSFVPKKKQQEEKTNKIEQKIETKIEQKPEKETDNMKLNLGADPYIPRNNKLKNKEETAHPKKEEKPEEQESKLTQYLNSDFPTKSTKEKSNKSNHNKDSDKNTRNNLKKKNSKKNDYDKKFESLVKGKEMLKKEEEEKKRKEREEKKRKEEERKKREEEERERKRKEEEEKEKKRKEEEERKKREQEKIIERKYFITFKNKKSEKIEKFTFEYITQFKKWKICTEDDLLTKEVKKHFDGFKEETHEGTKKKKDREENPKKKDNYTKKREKEKEKDNIENKSAAVSMGQWARKDLTKEIKAAETFKQKFIEESKLDPVKKDLRNLLNILTHDNYKEIKEEIFKKIKDKVEDQEKFLDVLFQKAVLEKAYAKLYSKLVKDLDKELPQKSNKENDKEKEKETENKKEGKKVVKKEYSQMRKSLINKCKTIFQLQNNEQFDQYIKEKDPEERRNKLKKFMLGNVNFITELMKIKILSKKVGPDCLKNLYERYQKLNQDKTLKELTIEAIIIFSENFGRIVYEEKKMKESDKQFFNEALDDIFSKLEKIMNEPSLVGYIKYNILNLLEKRKNNFALSKFDESLIAKTKEQVEKELESEGQITQENINEKIKKELKNYKEYSENKNNDENEAWKISSKLLQKRINYGKTFGDILEAYFEAASEIIETEKNPEYVRTYIEELIDYYIKDFSHKDVKELKERIIKLFEIIVDISLDIPKIFDIYAYVLNIFLSNRLIEFSDLSELQKEDINIENISETLKYLADYYKKDDFYEKLKELPYVRKDLSKFKWAFN